MESECTKVGKNLAFTRVELFVEEKLIATGNHTKYMGKGTAPNE
jgi:acyl-coenzyme A thioesterase PaaI-like protein